MTFLSFSFFFGIEMSAAAGSWQARIGWPVSHVGEISLGFGVY
jgi:hypothetical protein